MTRFDAAAWTADWLNAWLAAIGVAVLLEDVELAWDVSNPSHAVFESRTAGDLPLQVFQALPAVDEIRAYALVRDGKASHDKLNQAVDAAAFGRRAKQARELGDFTFACAVTDAAPPDDARLPSSPFNPPMPKGVTLWERFNSCIGAVLQDSDPVTLIARSMSTGGVRVKQNGLGFDYRRIPVPTDPNRDVWVDPVVETLAFFGLSLLPIRGDGRYPRVRGWHSQDGRSGLRKSESGAFRWSAWADSLTVGGIDAYLDRFWGAHRTSETLAVFAAVPYESKGSSDMTRGFASRRVP